MPGDWATVEADGTVRLLGRGSQVINTGGEKVHPEEIEESLKSHDDVADAAVVGVPDERFGQQIAAVVALEPGRSGNPDALDHHVREHLAGYKAPRRYVFVDSLNRSPNGKLDYKALAQIAYVEPQRPLGHRWSGDLQHPLDRGRRASRNEESHHHERAKRADQHHGADGSRAHHPSPWRGRPRGMVRQ